MVPGWAQPAVAQRCAAGDDSACVRLMQAATRDQIAPPISIHARQSFLTLAIDAGGPGTYGRLLAARGQPLDARLAAATGLPVDSLVSRWRAWILAARPKTVAADPRAAWAAVGWGVLL